MVMYKAAGTLKPSATSCVVDVGSRPIAEVPCYVCIRRTIGTSGTQKPIKTPPKRGLC